MAARRESAETSVVVSIGPKHFVPPSAKWLFALASASLGVGNTAIGPDGTSVASESERIEVVLVAARLEPEKTSAPQRQCLRPTGSPPIRP